MADKAIMKDTLKVSSNTYSSLASMLEYPTIGYRDAVSATFALLKAQYSEAAHLTAAFLEEISSLSDEDLEEVYTRTFDVAPLCVPYVTSYIYGPESFERGELMSKLADIYKQQGFDAGPELPDHLAVLLRFADTLDQEELADLVVYCLRKPLSDMIAVIEGSGNPYSLVLRVVDSVLKRDFPEDTGND